MSQRKYRRVMIICGACFAFFFLAAEVMAQVPRADLRGQLSRYRTSTTRAASATTAIPARSAFPANATNATNATGAARGRQTLSQFQLLQLQQQLLLQKQQLNPQQFTLVPDGRGGVVAVPVVNQQIPLAIPVGSAAVQQQQRRVNRIRVGR